MSQPTSPGPAYSDGGTPGKGGFGLLNSLKKALPHSPRPHSPASSLGGSEAGTPPSRSKLGFPSFSNGQRKRDIIKKLEDDVSLLQLQLHQRDAELAQLHQQVSVEAGGRLEAQERLNMQYFKSHLLADMLVAKLLDLEAPAAAVGSAAVAAAPAAAGGPATRLVGVQPTQQQQQQVVMAGGGNNSGLRESSFD